MIKLNYHHLYYFWVVFRSGGLSEAARRLHLTPQTLSGQLSRFQTHFSDALFERRGRRLRLTTLGEHVFEHAERVFAQHDQLGALMEGRVAVREKRILVGAADVLAKLSVRRILEPLLSQVVLRVQELDLESLLDALREGELDVVLSDRPVTGSGSFRLNSQCVASCPIAVFAAHPLYDRLCDDFPHSLDDAPVLLPGPKNFLRRQIDQYFYQSQVKPRVVGEIEDSALLKAFGENGHGFFFVAEEHAADIERHYRAHMLGRATPLTEALYAITPAAMPLKPSLKTWIETTAISENF